MMSDKKRFSTTKDDSNAESLPRKKNNPGRSVDNNSRPATAPSPTPAPAVVVRQLDVGAILQANSGNGNAGQNEGERSKNPRKRNRKPKGGDANGEPSQQQPQQQPRQQGQNLDRHRNPPKAVAMEVDEPEEKLAHLTDKEFTSLDISPNTIKALVEVMRFRFMTQVQRDSLPDILKGHDALVKAKTGTGKTVGFLVPSIEILMKERQRLRATGPQPRILILSPTRELAQQIAAEASALCTFHRVGINLLVGGTNMNADKNRIKQNGEGHNDIIVATPGRMLAHLQETPGFSEMVKGVKVFVMDEADRLLDMGFKRELDQIIAFLNQRDARQLSPRQTLLFSATVAPEVQAIARATLLPGFKFIDTVGEEVEQTHAHVPQHVMTVPLDLQVRAMVAILEEQKRVDPDYKMILFFPTARQTGFYATILNSIGLKVLEIHSRKSQAQRTRTSEEFRVGKNVILLSSDVSARGMDYPDVSFVLQVGMTARDQYIHRLGRTARAGKEGAGLLVLAPFEEGAMMKELADMPLVRVPAPDLRGPGSVLVQRAAATLVSIGQNSEEAFGEDSEKDSAAMAWAAWLGYYNGMLRKINLDKEGLVQLSTHYAASIGLAQIPALQAKTIGKMGMKGVPGLRVEANRPSQGRGQQQQPKSAKQAPAAAATAAQPAAAPAPSRPAGSGDAYRQPMTAPLQAPRGGNGGRGGPRQRGPN